MKPSDFSQLNTASVLLTKIGSGCADADFARAVHKAVDRVIATEKNAKVVLTIEVVCQKTTGALVLSASVEAKIPKLPAPATQMHVGPKGELLTQMEYLMGGGPSEAAEKPLPITANASQGSARMTIAKAPAPAPIAPAPTPAPLVGKDAAAGKDA